jgi:predicted nuclease with TOPRIM domain
MLAALEAIPDLIDELRSLRAVDKDNERLRQEVDSLRANAEKLDTMNENQKDTICRYREESEKLKELNDMLEVKVRHLRERLPGMAPAEYKELEELREIVNHAAEEYSARSKAFMHNSDFTMKLLRYTQR